MKDKINKVVQILMDRDGLSRTEAENQFKCAKELISDAISSGDAEYVEDIMYSELGLEMDYIMDVLD